jgi:hypothetical protein
MLFEYPKIMLYYTVDEFLFIKREENINNKILDNIKLIFGKRKAFSLYLPTV